MKNIFVILISILLIISCNKDEIEVTKEDTPQYNESNSATLTWEEMPEELKNAPQLDTSLLKSSSYAYSVGPWGGTGGSSFSYAPPANSKIYAMAIRAGSRIDRIVVWYKLSDNTIYVGLDRGGDGGNYYLQYFADKEYIRSISGRSGSRLDKIAIVTDQKSFTYGGSGGTPFSVGTLPSNYQILGFYGRSGSEIDQIGFFVYTRN